MLFICQCLLTFVDDADVIFFCSNLTVSTPTPGEVSVTGPVTGGGESASGNVTTGSV